MRILVRTYGGLLPRGSSTPLEMEVEDGAIVADIVASLGLRPGEVWLAKLDDRLVEMDHPLKPGGSLSLIPPVGGGD